MYWRSPARRAVPSDPDATRVVVLIDTFGADLAPASARLANTPADATHSAHSPARYTAFIASSSVSRPLGLVLGAVERLDLGAGAGRVPREVQERVVGQPVDAGQAAGRAEPAGTAHACGVGRAASNQWLIVERDEHR